MGGDDAARIGRDYTQWDWIYDREMERYSLDDLLYRNSIVYFDIRDCDGLDNLF
ncbi:hypothetical protein D1872_174450 [compost metagenome]